MEAVKDILKEDSKRMVRIKAPYDPLVGEEPGAPIDIERCRRDFPYWAARCCYIKNKEPGADILLRLNAPQRKLVAELEKMRTAGKPIRLILLKARQWGGSTCIQIYMAWLQMMHSEGLNSLIVAHQHSATAEIKDMFMRMIESYPEVAPISGIDPCEEEEKTPIRKKKKSKSKRIEHVGPSTFRVLCNNFKLKVASAERPDACRGGDYSLVHFSEVALWKKTRLKTPEDQFRSASSGVLFRPLTMIVLESTANGTGNFFHTEYQSAREGKSQFQALFIPWFEIEQ